MSVTTNGQDALVERLERLEPASDATPFDRDDGVVAHDPRVMAGRDVDDVCRAELELLSAIRGDVHGAAHDHPEVAGLAPLATHERADVRGPAPAGSAIVLPTV